MKSNMTMSKCPVCSMEVNTNDISLDYQGAYYIFCSIQCLERFQANPHLYIGYPGSMAPKQKGKEVLKQRTLKLSEPMWPELEDRVINHILSMMGIKDVAIDGDYVRVTYDLLQATEEQIEQEIARSGGVLGQDWAEKLRRAFVHYMEETEVLTMEARPGSMRGHNH